MNFWVVEKMNLRLHYPNKWVYYSRGHRLLVHEPTALLPSQRYVIDEHNRVRVHEVLHFENLTAGFARLMHKYNMNVTLPQHAYVRRWSNNKTRSDLEHYKCGKRLTPSHLCPESIRLINLSFKRDFEMFGYAMMSPNTSTVKPEICQWLKLFKLRPA